MKVRNITVSVDEETHRQARIRAAELDTSISALVRRYLQSLVSDRENSDADASDKLSSPASVEARNHRREKLLEAVEKIRQTSPGFSASENLPREELYARGRSI